MKKVIVYILFFGFQYAHAGNKSQCLNGDFSSCKTVVNDYGSKSKKDGAVSFFNNACSSQNLKVTCEVTSSLPKETLKKTMELAKKNSALFVVNGKRLDKIYRIKSIQ